MKRLGIFCFYEENGYVDEYVNVLLESLKDVLQEIIVVSNGKLNYVSHSKLKVFSLRIFERDNIGFDAGAYKDCILDYCKDEDWHKWDEIVLFNSTFYGPLIPWNEVFKKMEKIQVDFWGLNRCLGGKGAESDFDKSECISSYFIVIKKRMFLHTFFQEFWSGMKYPSTYWEAVTQYEYRFTQYFKQKGFIYTSWLDVNGGENLMKPREVPYIEYPYRLISEFRFPIIKHKALSVFCYCEAKKVLQYLTETKVYDVELIWIHLKRLEKNGKIYPFSLTVLKDFVETHKKIYIFGHGQYGRGLEGCFKEHGWKIEAFVVTAPSCHEEMALSELHMEKEDGLIVAVSTRVLLQMKEQILENFEKKQILFPI